jgi:hypothetical protein
LEAASEAIAIGIGFRERFHEGENGSRIRSSRGGSLDRLGRRRRRLVVHACVALVELGEQLLDSPVDVVAHAPHLVDRGTGGSPTRQSR